MSELQAGHSEYCGYSNTGRISNCNCGAEEVNEHIRDLKARALKDRLYAKLWKSLAKAQFNLIRNYESSEWWKERAKHVEDVSELEILRELEQYARVAEREAYGAEPEILEYAPQLKLVLAKLDVVRSKK